MIYRSSHTAATVTVLEEFSEVVLIGGVHSFFSTLNNTQIGRFGKFVLTWELWIIYFFMI